MKLLFLFFPIATAFTVIPYIQIDYAHMFQRAQCQAKCVEKYGTPTRRTLNDGTIEEFIENNSEEGRMCEFGCQQNRRGHKKTPRGTDKTPLHVGARFWSESAADSTKHGTSPISQIELLCQNPSNTNDIEESAEGIIGLRLIRPAGPVRYVIQWKQRTNMLGSYDESQWITTDEAETSTSFKVDGLIPNVQYRFMVTAVGPQGRLGDSILSEWSEISISEGVKVPGDQLILKNGYNSEHGALVNLQWNRSPYDSCYYRLQYSNSTREITHEFTLDSSKSFMVSNLEFDGEYSVKLLALSRPELGRISIASRPITSKLKAIACKSVYGKNSTQCPPDPVENLKVVVRSNGSATISWSSHVDSTLILTYQVYYQALNRGIGCQTELSVTNVKAEENSKEIYLAGLDCEYLVRVINYDLRGQDAQTETRVIVRRAQFPSFIQIEYVIISLAICALIVLCILLKCLFVSKCPVRVSEKSVTEKLTDSYA